MSTFGGFGSGGFGSTANNNQQSTGFGGFGSTTGTTGFGTSNTGTGFGATNTSTTGGGLFGSTSGSGFGSGGFGASATSSPFGQNKPAFGSTATTSSGGLFGGGSTTATSGSTFGGFGGTSSTPAFGSGAGTSTGGLFGQSKPAFGTTTSGGLFGSGGGSSSGFGTSGTSTGFGTNATPAFGGGANNATNEGTGKVPFSEMTEKDPSASNTTNRYQTITTIDPYKNFSLEELRLVDYAQGRKYGNQNGQAGAFGTSTGFGGFGSTATPASTGFGTAAGTTSGGLFGGANTSTGFGQQPSTTSTGFGSGTTGGLFGAKPATGGGLFGNTTTTTTQPSGGLFGGTGGTGFGSGTTSTGFGSGTTTGGLFGSTAAKPATGFGGFGSGTATSAAGTGTGFGASTGFGSTAPATGGGLFGGGSGTTTSAFGTQQQPAATGGFSFGQQNQQAQPAQTSGGLFGGGGAFGQQNQQQKTGGLFGSTTTATGGGLFGQPAQQQQSTGGGLFGGGTQQQSTGGLFGAKPATGGLFGGSTTGTTGGLFGGSQPQQTQTSGGLFGGSQQQSGGLFGSKPATTGLGSSLFGGGQNQQQQSTTGGLFGGSQQQQPAMGSLFGGSQQQQQPQQPQALTANLLQNPYGNDALFANIGTPTQSVGPIATPLSTSQKNKKPAMIPSYRLNPNASSRLLTPQKRPAGYGFSYSTYGTPGSAISNASPLGLGNSLLSASSYGRSLNKSMSTSNLRSSFSAEDSILNPGAFAGTSRGGTGSLKKLNINKNLNVRRSLFGHDAHTTEPRKSVSFEASNKDVSSSSSLFGPSNGQLVRTESPPAEPSVTSLNGANKVPEMAQVNGVSRGKELAIVPENGSPVPHGAPAAEVPLSQKDKVAGDYYMNPSEQEIAHMSRDEKANVKDFTVGRQGCGKIVFSKVNLNEVNIQDICDKIVQIQTRQATVYGDELVAKKPPRGQGLNVPSLITLENSWPRSAAGLLPVHEKKGLRYEKHIKRLKRVTDTNFVSYNDKTGEWTFSVEHFTTYGFPEDDEDESMMESSILEDVMDEAPGTPTPSKYSSKAILPHVSPPFTSDSSLPSPPESSPDDTFDFKKGPRKHLPGQFSDEDLGDVNMVEDDDEATDTAQSFLGERSVGSLEDDDMSQASESGTVEDQEMAGSFPKPAHTTELSAASHTMNGEALKPKSILKASQTVSFGTPLKTGQLLFGADWAEQLQRTVSPKKQDRAALRANQPTASTQLDTEPKPKPVQNDKPFTNSIDLINELFNRSAAGRKTVSAKFGDSSRDFEQSPPKRIKTRSAQETSAKDEAFHNSNKPSWGPHGTLVYTAHPVAPPISKGIFQNVGKSIVGEHNDVRFARFSNSPNPIPETIAEQRSTCSHINLEKGIPKAGTHDDFDFDIFAEKVDLNTDSGVQEQRIWELANILFDDMRLNRDAADFEARIRKEILTAFWKKLVHADALAQVSRAQSAEEKALLYLSGGMVEEACMALIEGKNFKLATLVAQIGGDKTFRAAIAAQIESWRQLNILSEINDHVRAIWELLAGNTSICKGQAVAGIENKVASFSFSSRFKLDWRRSFGLRLWYGIEATDDTSVAVKKFLADLKSDTETAKPVPWFVEKGGDEGWNDPESNTREDVLWSMLRLYTNKTTVALEAAFAPENVSGNPMDARLSFQLVYLFSARGIGSITSGPAAADDLATTYASCVSASVASNPDAVWYACWALLHLSEPQARVQSIRALLDQHAAILDPEDRIFSELLNLRIPSSWMFLSRALYARAVEQDPVTEAQCLIEAGEWSQAHDVVCRVVGPKAVIEDNSDQLRELLGSLKDGPGHDKAAWEKGAGVYYDYVEMRDLDRVKGQRWKELVRCLSNALKSIMSEGLQGKDLTERAALQIIGRTVAKIATSGEVLEKNDGLRLPLTEDAYLAQSRALSLDYFRSLLASH